MDLNWIMSQTNCKTIKGNQENLNTGCMFNDLGGGRWGRVET